MSFADKPFVTTVTPQMAYDWMSEHYNRLSEISTEPLDVYLKPYHELCDCSNCYLIVVNDVPVGVCLIPKATVSYLSRIYILDEYRGIGIGKYAINFLKVKAVACLKENEPALNFYLSIGFRVKHTHTHVVDLVR